MYLILLFFSQDGRMT